MKIRSGFVSNSSSSSFIVVGEDQVKLAKKHNVKLYKVASLILIYKPLEDAIEYIKLQESKDLVPPFMETYCAETYYTRLYKLDRDHPGCYITTPFDRDWAYNEELTFSGTFESDL